MINNTLELIPISSIITERSTRQRTDLTIETIRDLALSIVQRSLIHPIIIDQGDKIVAGETRLGAFLYLAKTAALCPWADYQDWTLIPARRSLAQNPTDNEAIELEENVKRTPLQWQDEARAILRYHTMIKESEPSWTHLNTGTALGMGEKVVRKALEVGRELNNGDERIMGAASINSAYGVLSRRKERLLDNAVHDIGAAIATPTTDVRPSHGTQSLPSPTTPPPPSAEILQADFHNWANAYRGPKFNLIHCDFPYGVNHQKSDQGRSAQWGSYEDDPDVYWKLIDTFLTLQDSFLSPSAHCMFWFSMNFYEETKDVFTKAGWKVQAFPLIWHKSDNKGILPDSTRGPRRIYETAFLLSRGDRKIVKAVSNLYAAPGAKKVHLSEKPVAMLRHFLTMLVDEHSRILDPTCGSGNAIQAADALGAGLCLGLEVVPEFATIAQVELAKALALKAKAQELRL